MIRVDRERFPFALRASLWHLLGSMVVASFAAMLVFFVWYPSPYSELAGGRDLFIMVIAVDVICGPLLTLVLFNPRKSKRELMIDFGLVAIIQLGALGYGLYTVALARPIFLAFEIDRFRVVTPADLFLEKLDQAPASLRRFSYTGPKMMAIRVARPEDADYLQELEKSVSGMEAPFRPERWELYTDQVTQVLSRLKPVTDLLLRFPQSAEIVNDRIAATGLKAKDVGWLPIRARKSTGWIALVNNKNAAVVGFAPVDGF